MKLLPPPNRKAWGTTIGGWLEQGVEHEVLVGLATASIQPYAEIVPPDFVGAFIALHLGWRDAGQRRPTGSEGSRKEEGVAGGNQ